MEHHQSTEEPTVYEPPKVVDYGSLTDITAGSATGNVTDAAFPIGTPATGLTFS